MKIKLIFLLFLLPFISLGAVVLAAFVIPSFPAEVMLDLAYLFTVLLGIRLLKHRFSSFKWDCSLKEFSVALMVGLTLFGSFYVENVVFRDYIKGEFGLYAALSAVVLAPVMEEFFTKALLLDNLKKFIGNPVFPILISAVYFWILHFPTFMVTHLLIGLATATHYYFRKNLFLVIVIHSVYNLMVVSFQNF